MNKWLWSKETFTNLLPCFLFLLHKEKILDLNAENENKIFKTSFIAELIQAYRTVCEEHLATFHTRMIPNRKTGCVMHRKLCIAATVFVQILI